MTGSVELLCDAFSQPMWLADEAATLALGERVVGFLRPPMVVHLVGELGAGKTTLVRGMLRGLGFTGRVQSPTYALLQLYSLGLLTVAHFDLYRLHLRGEIATPGRLAGPQQAGMLPQSLEDVGFRDYLNPATICLIEWPGEGVPGDVVFTLEAGPEGGRWFRVERVATTS